MRIPFLSFLSFLAACTGQPATPPAPDADADADADTDTDTDTDADADADTDTDADTDADADTDTARADPDVTLCDASPFPDVVERIHTCPTPCTGGLAACAVDSSAETGWPSQRVNLVADGRAAVVRWATGSGPTLFLHNGGTGTSFAPRLIPDAVVAAGGRPVEVAWHAATATGTDCDDADCGWLTRPLASVPSSIAEVSGRPAAVIAWAKATLAPSEPFGTLGCSAGSLATFYARTFQPLDPILDHQTFLGGPLVYDADWACRGRTTGCSGTECGRCRTDPSVVCAIDGPANQCVGAGGTCASYRLTGSLGLLEVLYLDQATCPAVSGTDYTGGDLATGGGDTTFEHPVDFVLNTNPIAVAGDDDLGISPNAWEIRQAMSGPDITFTNEPGAHCAAFSAPSTCEQVLGRMGLGAMASTHCTP